MSDESMHRDAQGNPPGVQNRAYPLSGPVPNEMRQGRMISDVDRHGPWNKEQQRYEDGCEVDRPHDDAPLYQTLKQLGKDPNEYRAERIQPEVGPLKFVKNGVWYRAIPVNIPVSMTQVTSFDDSISEVRELMDADVLTVHEDGIRLTYNGEDYIRMVHGTPAGLTVSDDETLINWRGDNFVRQTPADMEAAEPERINDLFTEVLVLRLREALAVSGGSDAAIEVAKQIRILSDAAAMIEMQGIGARLVPTPKEGS